MTSKIERILIVGGGIAGLSLAIGLRERDVSADVVERRSASIDDGAGLYLVGNAVRALGVLGLAESIVRLGAVIRSQRFLNQRGQTLFEIDTANYWWRCGSCLGIRRADLQRALQDRLGAANVRFDTSVSHLDQHDRGVAVAFSDGTQREYDFVVGADGIRSSIRRLVFGGVPPRYCGQVGWRFLVACPADITGWTVMLGPRGAVLLVPVGAGQAYCYCDFASPQSIDDPREGRVERLRSRFEHFARPALEAMAPLTSESDIHFAAIEEIDQEPWGSRRVLLVGDAAHATLPNMASGAAMALEDALVLCELVASGRDAANVIAEFTRRRSPRVRWVREQARRRDRMRSLPGTIRNLILRVAGERIYRANYEPLLDAI
ncbi:MAG: FAD-dependent monooxygenase [Burkholderiales bacterium]